MEDKDKIDIVLIWVDDSDPEWQESYREYSLRERGESGSVRFRDWGTLKYWFRGIEKFAPWVNRVFFITCGHYPEWLNLNHPKLRFVKHSDYIPAEYLPTFNSHTIELNLHRIKDLSERFVYFNDDTFLIGHIPTERFFRNGLPCDMAVLNAPQPMGASVDYYLCNMISYANKHFNKRDVMKAHRKKWFTPIYGGRLLRTFALYMYPHFTGFVDPHLPNAFLKNTFEEVWNNSPEILDKTCRSKFREYYNVSQYIMRYQQLLKGDFEPINPYKTSITYSALSDDLIGRVCEDIRAQRKPLICINDGEISDFAGARDRLVAAFEEILPEKSQYEK